VAQRFQRCDSDIPLAAALQFAEKAAFVSGHRFSDAASASK
jgi:hypothetical protein